MGLSIYHKKRDFTQTPEPAGKERISKTALRFVIQKHDASSLHYDFRLEMEGVLKSWAIPKGPSTNTADKRLAMMVEDHPYDYRNFEGVIPEGNYGAGTVIIWDEGYYEPAVNKKMSKKEQEKILFEQLAKGSIKIYIHGKKLKGLYTLRQLKKDDEKTWLLIKSKDEHANTIDVTEEDYSVKTGKTLLEVAEEHGATLNHPVIKNSNGKKKASVKQKTQKVNSKQTATNKKNKNEIPDLLRPWSQYVLQSDMPVNVKPMLATLVDEPFDHNEWLYEIKWDGYRALAYVDNEVKLISRNNKPFTGKYAPVASALKALNIRAVFDGEIVAVDENGLANFQLLQNWQNAPVELQFYIFDIIWYQGFDVTAMPLIERKRLLQQILPDDNNIIRYSEHVEGDGKNFFKAALKNGLEGIMAKRSNSIYELGKRTADWLKIKVNQRQEVVIAGFTQPRKSRKFFGALLLGVYEGPELIYVGHTGSGFDSKSLEDVWQRLQPLIIQESPFKKKPKTNMPATWVQPKLVCEIKFTEWTKDNIARHPIFMGLREDKSAKEVKLERMQKQQAVVKKATAQKSNKAAADKQLAGGKKTKTGKVAGHTEKGKIKTSGLQLDVAEGKDQEVVINQVELHVSSLDKLYWKKEGYRKGDAINYCLRMAPYILPYLMDRPHSLNRHPNGVDASNFFQKDMKGKLPEWMQIHEDFSESTNTTVKYLVCNGEHALVYMANLGCIEMNPWHARSGSWQRPDWCLIDLDPEGVGFDKVIEVALMVKKVLDEIGVEGYCKTSGATGMHIYIPLEAKYEFEQSKQLAELICTLVMQELPSITSMERNPDKRKRKVYLDFLQNKETQTAAAPYSLRPKREAPVSTPLHWDEVKKGLTPTTFTIKNIFERVKAEGDLFRPVLGKGIDLEKIIQKLSNIID